MLLYLCSHTAWGAELSEIFIDWVTLYAQENQTLAEEIYQNAIDQLENPIDLNQVNREELEKFAFLSDFQIENLLEYRHDFQFFATKYELCLVEGFDENTLALLLPFVWVKEDNDWVNFSTKHLFKNINYKAVSRFDYLFQPQKGYTNQQYLGKPWAGYLHFWLKNSFLSISSLAEKDRGEPFIGPYNKGFDFYSGHIQVKNIHALKTFVVGDYRAQFGQGLIIGGNYTFSGSNFSSFSKRNDHISGYKSTGESQFLRGAGLNLSAKNWQFNLLSSIKYIDKADGIHRTWQQWQQKKEGYAWCIGANISARYTHFKVGTTFLYDDYTQLAFVGLDYRTYWKNIQFSGEIGINHQGKIATIHTVHATLNSTFSWILQLRYYGKEYNNAYGYNSNTDTSFKHGEAGIISGIQWQMFKGAQLNGYMDLYKKLDHAYRISKPSVAYKTYVSFTYLFDDNQQLFAKWQWSKQEQNFSGSENGTLPTYDYHKNSVVVQYSGTFTNGLFLKSSVVANSYQFFDQQVNWGYVVYQDIGYKHPYFQCTARICFFDVPQYEQKITVYEHDVPYTYSNTVYFGNGIRSYLNVGIFPYRGLGIYFKIGHWYYLHQQEIGSGNETIPGPHKTNLHLLLQYKW